jgi:hypothetical protein
LVAMGEKSYASPEWAAGMLRIQKDCGAEELKIWKAHSLHVRDLLGHLVEVDDHPLDPIWQTEGEICFPVVIIDQGSWKLTP